MSDIVAQALIAAVSAIVLAFVTALFQLMTQRAIRAQGEKAAEKVEEVKRTLATTTANTDEKIAEAAVKVEEVKRVLFVATASTAEKIAAAAAQTIGVGDKVDGLTGVVLEVKETGDVTHALVNSSFVINLRVASVALRRVADLTKDQADQRAAEVAEKAYREHEERQAVIESTPPGPPGTLR